MEGQRQPRWTLRLLVVCVLATVGVAAWPRGRVFVLPIPATTAGLGHRPATSAEGFPMALSFRSS
jgi:hypothetical protein